ncbi:CBS domain-containing protein [Paraburkholderia acidisoli]|uniref:CBS domain-containing protein n=1 Tax=Paraburkholderia acidisoli TaxID=2571748 RepID=A0A7Z2GPT2_9BURK|nr:CBS domain-containing protein [Paraburkholderia acidisoli]QGZ65727.1 CBS domain-containing protein [Paraburkholderia acidisoli]
MTPVREIMSRDIVRIAPASTIEDAARLMRQYDVGALPVCDGKRVVGMVTDRDLAVRALALQRAPHDAIEQIATENVQCCFEDEDLDTVQRRMAEAQVRRVPVLNRQREIVGTVSIGDFATRCAGAQRAHVINTLEDISQRRVAGEPKE